MYTTSNLEVRQAIRDSGLCAYQVAELIGVTETSFSRLMRGELSQARKAEILNAIKQKRGQEDGKKHE